MSWQKCPICEGTGKASIMYMPSDCHVCLGSGIISELTGLPPKTKATSSDVPYNQDFIVNPKIEEE
jgi:RecJ-like exonuclease